MEDLKNKTDEELMDIMRNSVDNQYVPSSIYHKAKQELEFRKYQQIRIPQHTRMGAKLRDGRKNITRQTKNLNKKSRLAITVIDEQIAALEGVVQNAKKDGNDVLADERIERWKTRTVRLLSKHVNQTEAKHFSRKKLNAIHLTNGLQNIFEETVLYKGALQALREEIENYPEHVFVNVSSPLPTVPNTFTEAGNKYDVAFSFSRERRDYVRQVAKYISSRGVDVFYDEDQELDMWGKNLIDYLEDIFKNRAKHCVMFISKEYAEREWPNFERQIIQAKGMIEKGYLLPARFDMTPIKGLADTIKYENISSKTPIEFGEFIVKKITAGAMAIAPTAKVGNLLIPYRNGIWIAKSERLGERHSVPGLFNSKNFEHASCNVRVINAQDNHWRAGIIFRTLEGQEYTFLVHEDVTSPGLLQTRIVHRIGHKDKSDASSLLRSTRKNRNFRVEVKKIGEDILALLVNGEHVDSFSVPLSEISKVFFAAWADNRPFEIEFRDIEVNG
jgi:hypothetical protein